MVTSPQNLRLISATSGDVVLAFDGAAGVDHYDLYRSVDQTTSGSPINVIGIPEPAGPDYTVVFEDNGVNTISPPIAPNVYRFMVVAVDSLGNFSLPSNILIVPLSVNEVQAITPKRVDLISVEVRGN